MPKCKDCLKLDECKPYTTPDETFPETDGCKAFRGKDGQWVQKPSRLGGAYTIFACSVCDKAFTFHPDYNFCPHCGADMRGANND